MNTGYVTPHILQSALGLEPVSISVCLIGFLVFNYSYAFHMTPNQRSPSLILGPAVSASLGNPLEIQTWVSPQSY